VLLIPDIVRSPMDTTVKIFTALGQDIPGALNGEIHIGLTQTSTSPVINSCIYCGSNYELTDEHPIPYGLKGIAKLKKASCITCSLKTQRLEHSILRKTFGVARQYLKMPSRKSKKSGRWNGKAAGYIGESEAELEFDILKLPIFLAMAFPNYLPRILTGENFGTKHKTRDVKIIPINPLSLQPGETGPSSRVTCNTGDMERLACKIAYGEFIRLCDQKFRDERISKFILGEDIDSSLFIGSFPETPVTSSLHDLTIANLRDQDEKLVEDMQLLTVRIFSFLPTPTYAVILQNLPLTHPSSTPK
jgi:hypothetical protein